MALGDGPHYGCGEGGSYGWSFSPGVPRGGGEPTYTPAETASFEPADHKGKGRLGRAAVALAACGALAAFAVGIFGSEKD